MAEEQVKLNKLGKPMKRGKGGRFAPGNQEGMIYGKDHEPKGRPKGSKNICTIIKEIALEKSSNHGMSNIEWIVYNMVDAKVKLKKFIDETDKTTKGYANALANYAKLSGYIMEQLAKYSGDYTAKFKAEIGDELSDEEREIMEKALKSNGKKPK